ncbi:zinc metalloprotease [Crucibulum laeve]|uniref:Disintegrin and metalloproteinase domain-containing protein B n=1 Tax=Crucibulum laeve TaxID=68775 RepID=A0A5C3M9L9_9AGAR|nr:zinc metalloprotease [Crucibulum laeve]
MLFYSSFYALVVFVLALCSLSSNAHSTPARPLKRLASPSTLSLEILPRQPLPPAELHITRRQPSPYSSTLRYDDSFRLIISAFDDTFHLHLRPNDHLIHPAARITYYTTQPDGSTVKHTKPLLRESVRAYLGEVIHHEHSAARMREDAAKVYHPAGSPEEIGWARIMVHNQGDALKGIAPVFEGAFSANGVIHHIMTKDNYFRTKNPLDPDVSHPLDADGELVIWRETDVMSPEEEYFAKTGKKPIGNVPVPQSCGHDRLDYNVDPAQNPILAPRPPVEETATTSSWFENTLGPWKNSSLYRRDDAVTGNGGMGTNFINTIGQTQGCPTTQKVLYMGVAADCTYTSKFGGVANATTQILTSWNSASSLYKQTFNVSLAIHDMQVRDSVCPTPANASEPWNVPCSGAELDTRLSLFSQWRGAKGDDGIGLWHLMSGCPTGSEVGIAWLATLCQQSATGNAPSIVSGTAVSTSGRTEWQVIAHEIGHNFGAIHDCADGCTTSSACCPLTSNTCDANAQFIMSPVAQSGEKVFSPCSVGNICSVMLGVAGGKVDTSCIVDPDSTKTIISLQMCGNGIVEPGEDCDPGPGMPSSCCNASTCKFNPGAVCDPASSPCCTGQCGFAPATMLCRPAKDNQCDFAEMCTGNSSACPADKVADNGQSCGSGDLKCASGQCTSISQQCQTVGSSMGLKDACPIRGDESCLISCQNPQQSNQCIQLTSLLIDGSPCGYGGTCLSGKCQAANLLDTAKAWYTQNLQISIPVTIVAALVALLLLWALFTAVRRCCGGGKRGRNTAVIVPGGGVLRNSTRSQHERLASYDPTRPYDRTAPLRTPPPMTSNAMYTRVPPAAHDRSGSAGGEVAYNYSANNRANWVDVSVYNGSRR